MKIFPTYTKAITAFMVAILLVGCTDDELLPTVESGFTHTVNEDTGTVTFLNTSMKATKYFWDFGDGETSTEINPIKTYTPGTFIVSLTASNVAGASDIFKDTLTIIIREGFSIPATFDNPGVDYTPTTFNGTAFEIVDNPDLSGTNNKATKVGAITNSGAAFEGIFFDAIAQIDLTSEKTISMNFWADAPISALLKLEEGTSGPIEATANHGGTGWEMIDFNFNSAAKFSRLTLFVDGPGTTAGTFYIDDITQKETVITCTAEVAENIDPAAGDINWTFKTSDLAHTFEAFGNTAGAIVANPLPAGINLSCNVEKFTKTAGCETFAGLGTALATALDFSTLTKKAFKMKVLAETQVTEVTLRLERLPFPDTEPSQDRVATITKVGEWEELTFDFSDVTTGTFKSMIIYFERNANCDGDVYYFDDIIQVMGTPPAGCTDTNLAFPINFDCAGVNYAAKIVGNVSFTVIDNPEQSGINNSNTKVGRITNVGANWENAFFNLDNALNFATGTTIKFKLYSTQALPIKLKFEDGTAGPVEADANHGGTGWEELTFNFTSGDAYNDMVIFVDGPGTAAGTFYVDDIMQVSGGGSSCDPPAGDLVSNGNFETGDACGWSLFQNGGTAALDNTTNNGGTWSGKLATGGPSNPAFKQERIGAGTVSAGDVVRISFDHIGAVVQPGAVFNVLLFGEGAAGASFTHVFNPAPVLGGTWTTFTGNFTIAPGTDVTEGISFLIEAVCGGDAGCSVSANIDNVSIKLNP